MASSCLRFTYSASNTAVLRADSAATFPAHNTHSSTFMPGPWFHILCGSPLNHTIFLAHATQKYNVRVLSSSPVIIQFPLLGHPEIPLYALAARHAYQTMNPSSR
jgi:hypothetical protein